MNFRTTIVLFVLLGSLTPLVWKVHPPRPGLGRP